MLKISLIFKNSKEFKAPIAAQLIVTLPFLTPKPVFFSISLENPGIKLQPPVSIIPVFCRLKIMSGFIVLSISIILSIILFIGFYMFLHIE